mgnify:CR=1 FL=1
MPSAARRANIPRGRVPKGSPWGLGGSSRAPYASQEACHPELVEGWRGSWARASCASERTRTSITSDQRERVARGPRQRPEVNDRT